MVGKLFRLGRSSVNLIGLLGGVAICALPYSCWATCDVCGNQYIEGVDTGVELCGFEYVTVDGAYCAKYDRDTYNCILTRAYLQDENVIIPTSVRVDTSSEHDGTRIETFTVTGMTEGPKKSVSVIFPDHIVIASRSFSGAGSLVSLTLPSDLKLILEVLLMNLMTEVVM